MRLAKPRTSVVSMGRLPPATEAMVEKVVMTPSSPPKMRLLMKSLRWGRR
jgi:hypothetical protein